MSELISEIRKIPPVTRFICTSLFSITLPCLLAIVPMHNLVFYKAAVTDSLQVWRLFTTFFIGGSGIGFIFDLAMFYQYSNGLEVESYARRSADYAWQIFLACVVLLGINRPLETLIHTRAFLVMLVYLSSALAPPGAKTSFFGLFTLPVVYLPYLFISIDLLQAGPKAAAVSTTGAIVGHLWWWGVWDTGAIRAWGAAPGWLARALGQAAGMPMRMGGGVTVVPPRGDREQEARTAGAHHWGEGRRLGTS